MLADSLHKINPDYLKLVQERTDGCPPLRCFEQVMQTLPEFSPVDTLLEIGCASGYIYPHISHLTNSYTGVDACLEYIELGKAKYRENDSVQLHCNRFEECQFPEKSFDIVLCLGLFYCFPNFHAYLDDMMRIAKKGIIIRSLFGSETQYRYVPAMPGSDYKVYYNIYGRQEVEKFVGSCGWNCRWDTDLYVSESGGKYQTAGQDFPFEFLIISSGELN